MSEKNREEHLAWCKERALEYCDLGDVSIAFARFAHDMEQHPETAGNDATSLGMMMLLTGKLDGPQDMRKFITEVN